MSGGLDSKFLYYWLRTSRARDFIQSHAKGTSPTMKKISQGIVNAIPFPVGLPLGDQQNLVKQLEGLESAILHLVNTRKEANREVDALLPSVTNKAFSGEL